MSDQDETIEMPALGLAFKNAALARGKDAALAVLKKHGASSAHWRSVPPSNHAAAIIALEALAGQTRNSADDTQRGLDHLQAQAFPPKAKLTAKTWAVLEATAMKRFNNPPPVERDQG